MSKIEGKFQTFNYWFLNIVVVAQFVLFFLKFIEIININWWIIPIPLVIFIIILFIIEPFVFNVCIKSKENENRLNKTKDEIYKRLIEIENQFEKIRKENDYLRTAYNCQESQLNALQFLVDYPEGYSITNTKDCINFSFFDCSKSLKEIIIYALNTYDSYIENVKMVENLKNNYIIEAIVGFDSIDKNIHYQEKRYLSIEKDKGTITNITEFYKPKENKESTNKEEKENEQKE